MGPFGVAAVMACVIALAGCSNGPASSTSTTATTAATGTSTTQATSTSTSSTTSTTAGATGAPCTQAAISAAATSTPSVGPVRAVVNYACSGAWAYANVTVGTTSSNSFDAVIVLQQSGSSWTVADRATACSNHLVPSAIYTQACTTS
jgi:hypothetical protein